MVNMVILKTAVPLCVTAIRNILPRFGRCTMHDMSKVSMCLHTSCTRIRVFSTFPERDNSVAMHENLECSPPITSVMDVNVITDGDPDLEKKLKCLVLEVEIFRQEGERVPSSLTSEQWKELVGLNTRSMRKRYLLFLFKTEMKRLNAKRKKEEKKQLREQEISDMKEKHGEHIEYGLHRNTIFMRIYDATITHFYNSKLIEAMQFNPKFVVDCGYDYHMTPRESLNCAKQITILFSENRVHPAPFNLYLCNVHLEGNTMKALHKYIPTMYDDNFPLNVTEKSYLDLFPKENIVYLTPHCKEELKEFSEDDIYVIGGIVDKSKQEPLSLAKAKREGLRMAKLPLDRYLSWGSGSGKSLTLNQMVNIMLDLRHTKNWKQALQHVPQRKTYRPEVQEQQFLKKSFGKELKFRKSLIDFVKELRNTPQKGN